MGILESRFFIDNTCLGHRRDLESQGPGKAELESWPPSPAPDQGQAGQNTLIELRSMANCPRMDSLSDSDPYVVVFVTRGETMIGEQRVFPYRLNCTSAVWDLKRIINAPLTVADGAQPDDELHFKIFDEDDACTTAILGTSLIGTARITISEIAAQGVGNLITIPLELTERAHERQLLYHTDQECTISVRIWPESEWLGWPKMKWIFLIRHGESLWNVAEREKSVKHMLETVDHCLSADGHRQGLGLAMKVKAKRADHDNQQGGWWFGSQQSPVNGTHHHDAPDDLYRRFMAADAIFVSPFTRAVQTALVTLQHHPLPAQKGFALRSELREIKNALGRDTIGRHKGDEITKNVHKELEAMYSGDGPLAQSPDAAATLELLKSIPIDPNNTSHEWWDSAKETQEMVYERMREVFVQLKYSPYENVILVGHSLLFNHFFKKHLSAEFRAMHPEFAKRISKNKMPNAGAMAVCLDFNKDIKECIIDAHLLFGTRIAEHGDEEHSEAESV